MVCLATQAPGAYPGPSILCGDESGGILVYAHQDAADLDVPLVAKLAAAGGGIRQLCWASPHAYCVSDGGLDLIVPARDAQGRASYDLVRVDARIRRVAVHGDDA